MGIDLARAREDTPGCENVLHFNNAGASLMPRQVLEATTRYLQLEAQIGGYEAAEQTSAAIEHTYDAIAALLGAQRDEIAIIENATRAWDSAFYSIPFEPGDKILTSVSEYASNYIAFLQVARRTGAQVEVVPNDEYGQISIEALKKAIDKKVKLVALVHVPTNGGLVNPAVEVGKVAKEAGILYLLDACQSAGQIPLDVKTLNCDFLSATGRKYLRGPRGTGFLYVRHGLIESLEPPLLDLHAAEWVSTNRYKIRPDARRFENWETYVAGKIGIGVAVDYALGWGLEAINARNTMLAEELRARLATIPGVTVRDQGEHRCGIVTFSVEGFEHEEIKRRLSQEHINVSVSSTSSTRLDMEARKLKSVIRASVHYYNTAEEVERFSQTLTNFIINPKE